MKSINKEKFPREYRIWKAMRARCNAPCYKNKIYQQRNIKVCERWNSFDNFINDMGPCPTNYSIDRIDTYKDYTPENCRWASFKTQAANRGKFNLVYTYKGETMCLKDWSRKLNIYYQTLVNRIHLQHLSFEEAITFIDDRDKPLEWNNQLYSRQQLCEMYNIPLQNFYDRWHKGWTLEKILTTPVKRKI